MVKKYYADIRADFRVFFFDNEEDDLQDQAIEALELALSYDGNEVEDNGFSVIAVRRQK